MVFSGVVNCDWTLDNWRHYNYVVLPHLVLIGFRFPWHFLNTFANLSFVKSLFLPESVDRAYRFASYFLFNLLRKT